MLISTFMRIIRIKVRGHRKNAFISKANKVFQSA